MRQKLFQSTLSLIYPATDFFVVAFSIMVSYKLYRVLDIGESVFYQRIDVILASFLVGFAAVVIMHGFGAYKQESSVLNVEEIKNVIKGITTTFVIVLMILVFGKFLLSRYVIFFSYILSLIGLVTEKTLFYHLPALTKISRKFHKRVLIYGAGEIGQNLFRELVNSPKLNIVPVGFIDDDPYKQHKIFYRSGFNSSDSLHVLGTRKDIPRLRKELDIDEIYVAISNNPHEALSNILEIGRAHV